LFDENDFCDDRKLRLGLCLVSYRFSFIHRISMAGGTGSGKSSATQLMAEANKKAKSAGGFFQRMMGAGSVASDDARALYVQAGNASKAESDYPGSVEAYKRALDLSAEDFEKAQMCEAIASSYKMFDLPQAVPALTRAAELHMSQGKWTMASQTLEKVAELYEQLNDLENMMKCLKEAHRFLKQEGQKAGANRVQKKMAEVLALQHEFMRAQQEYEEMADKTKDDAMLKYGAKDFWLRYSLDLGLVFRDVSTAFCGWLGLLCVHCVSMLKTPTPP
jgi:tetratricopeptide (TPR) repeat protein